MSLRKTLATLVFLGLTVCVITVTQVSAQAQGSASPASAQERRDEDTNVDTQLYLLVATNKDEPGARLPSSLDPVVAQLRKSLPFRNYHLAATLLNRVKNEGLLSLQWVGGNFMATGAATNSTPSFNEFRIQQVKLSSNAAGQPIINMRGFRFGARIPIQSGTAVAANGPAAPIINYEGTGLNTEISMREGEPVIVGTLNVGPSGDALILVISASRTPR